MLRSQTRLSAMKMKMKMLVLVLVLARTAAQPRCDPLTQYESEGGCCEKCGPGTSMSPHSSCQDPQCVECGDDEYQDEYTTETKCQRQPYCNRHRNLQLAGPQNKKTRSSCVCLPGFHCSSVTCITCVPHTSCKPGHGARSTGNQTHDTVCQKCPDGWFSGENSWSAACEKWAECQDGYQIHQKGTDVSDNICEKMSRQHTVLILVFVLLCCLALIAGAAYYLCRGGAHGKVKNCVESCCGGTTNPLVPIPGDEPSTFPERLCSQEDGGSRTPEENEDQPSEETSTGVIFSDNGKYVMQERGKTEILSRQESQTQTFTDSLTSE